MNSSKKPLESLVALPIPEPLLSLFGHLEASCVAGCCGLNAFILTPEHISPWVREKGIAAADTCLQQLRNFQYSLKQTEFSRLEIGYPASDFVEIEFNELLNHTETLLVAQIGHING